jgi:FMN phosphatase YigB (HAD superfamily)
VLRAWMAGELALAACRAPRTMHRTLRTLAAFRRLREDLRSVGLTSESIEELQYTRTAESVGYDRDVVRAVVAEWILKRPLRYMRMAAQPGLAASLSTLTCQGVQIGALSDYPTDAKLEALGIRRHFSVTLCTTERSINAFKPHPQGVPGCVRILGAPAP